MHKRELAEMKAYINELMTYGQFWGDPFEENIHAPWYSKETGETKLAICWVREKGIASLEEVESSGKYIRLFRTNAVKLTDVFMKQYLNTPQEWLEYYKDLYDAMVKWGNSFEGGVSAYMEEAGLDREWEDFLYEHCRADAIGWCEEHGIEWTEESPYDFSGFVPVDTRFSDCKQE